MVATIRPPRRGGIGLALFVVLAFVGPGPACVRGDTGGRGGDDGAERADAQERADLAREVEQLEAFSRVFRRVAALARPSVVSIQVHGRVEPRGVVQGDDFFRRFFGDPRRAVEVEVSQGTGVIVDRQGTVLTNNHVVGPDGARIVVTLHDGRSLGATVHGRDPRTDLALLRLDAPPDDLLPAVLGDSDALEVGDWVVAVGSPFGLQQSVTAGIVSAKGRADVGITDFEDFIQTDAAMNPGNSGGPLLNLRGEVVGINTAIASRTGAFQGVGFAIPIGMARDVARQLGERGRVVRAWLGVAIRELTAEDRRGLGLGERQGVVVAGVTPGAPAAAAGLRQGDVILAVDGEPAHDVQRLRHAVARAGVGDVVPVELWRDGRQVTVDVRLAELPDDPVAPPRATPPRATPPRAPDEAERPPTGLGLRARELTPELAARHGLDPAAEGVVITGVEPGGLAARAGVRPGWLLRAVDGQPVRTLDDLDAALQGVDLRRGVQLALEGPGGARQTVFMRQQ
ncbi:MAG: Do family serine endopeptidase [Planctomycetes bacterium]|nr:Do family serine endopeptidase [Planctomycetota bacterium]